MSRQVLVLAVLSVLSVAVVAAQQHPQSVTPLTATVQDTFTRNLAGGNTVVNQVTGNFYRDAQGRTRTERQNLVTVQDPVAHTLTVMDLTAGIARQFTAPQAAAAATGQSMSAMLGKSSGTDLGVQSIQGVPARGTQLTSVLPVGAVGNLLPIKQVAEFWVSDSLNLTVMEKTDDALQGEHVQIYTNIVPGAAVASSLFTVPSNMQLVQVASAPLPQGFSKLPGH
jgi:hypothetical protein